MIYAKVKMREFAAGIACLAAAFALIAPLARGWGPQEWRIAMRLLLDFAATSACYLGVAAVVSRGDPERSAGREAAFAWGAAALMFVCPLLVPASLAVSTWLALYACAWTLALSGFRQGRGGGRGAAVALMLLLLPYSAVVALAVIAG
ncbi:MAG: hypothetical protein U0835_01055 [Isosphaeraceae bacterium]